jgi:hypothetical protein
MLRTSDEILMPRVGLQFAPGRLGAKRGQGRYVVPPFAGASHPLVSATSPAEIMDVRLMLEPQIAALAARCATMAELAFVGQCFSACEGAPTYEAFETADAAFHRAIAAATQNEFLLRIFDVINALRNEPPWRSLKRRSFMSERRRTTNGIIAPSVKSSNSATASQRGYYARTYPAGARQSTGRRKLNAWERTG